MTSMQNKSERETAQKAAPPTTTTTIFDGTRQTLKLAHRIDVAARLSFSLSALMKNKSDRNGKLELLLYEPDWRTREIRSRSIFYAVAACIAA